MQYKILIFDLDDTLIDNKENVRAAFKAMLNERGDNYSEDSFERWYEIDKRFWVDWQDGKIKVPNHLKHEGGKKSDEFLDWVRSQRILLYFNNSLNQQKAVELNNVYMHALNEVVVPIEGAKDALSNLSRKKYKIVIATNGPRVATKQKLEKIGCLEFVTEILSADMYGYMKPRVEFFEAIEKRYDDYVRTDYLIIGDSLKSDIGFGMNSGIDSCWFNKNNEELESTYKPTFIIHKIEELNKLL